jgi:hypothetical protein
VFLPRLASSLLQIRLASAVQIPRKSILTNCRCHTQTVIMTIRAGSRGEGGSAATAALLHTCIRACIVQHCPPRSLVGISLRDSSEEPCVDPLAPGLGTT